MISRNYVLIIAVVILGVVLSSSPAGATTFYVAKTGADSNPCSSSQPCLTIGHGLSVAAGAGNLLYVESGTYNESPTVSGSGAPGNPFIVQGFASAGSCPTTNSSDSYSPTGTRPNPNVTTNGWTLSGNYVRVDCFKINAGNTVNGTGDDFWDNYLNLGGAGNSTGVSITNAVNCTIERNYIWEPTYGTVINGGSGCLIQDNEYDGLKLVGSTVSSSDMDYNRLFNTNHVTYRHNYMHNSDEGLCGTPASTECHTDCLQTWLISGTNLVHDITWDRNVCFNSLDGFMWRDTLQATYGSNYSFYNLTITNSIFGYKPGNTGWEGWCGFFDHVGNIKFQENVCTYKTTYFDHGSQATSYQNNIHAHSAVDSCTPYEFHNGSQAIAASKNMLQSDSCTVSATAYPNDIVNVKSIFVVDSTGDCGNSTCIGNFNIQSTSPAIAAGATGLGVTSDIDGNTRPSPPSVGAYEYGTGTSSSPLPPAGLQATAN